MPGIVRRGPVEIALKDEQSAAEFQPAESSEYEYRYIVMPMRVCLQRVRVLVRAELCRMPVEKFMEFAARHNVPLHYGAEELEEDRRTLERLLDESRARRVARDAGLSVVGCLGVLEAS